MPDFATRNPTALTIRYIQGNTIPTPKPIAADDTSSVDAMDFTEKGKTLQSKQPRCAMRDAVDDRRNVGVPVSHSENSPHGAGNPPKLPTAHCRNTEQQRLCRARAPGCTHTKQNRAGGIRVRN